MKNLTILLLMLFGITSCSKDNLVPQEIASTIQKSEISVTVSALAYDAGICGNGCIGSTDGTVTYLRNVEVNLYSGVQPEGDDQQPTIATGTTDQNGSAQFKDLAPGQYTIWVHTPLGDKVRSFYTQLNKRSYIEFSF